jgi:acetyl esterase/lipase
MTESRGRSHGAEGRGVAARRSLPWRQEPRTPLAAPLYADLSGLPPLLIQVGTAETLLDDASTRRASAKRAWTSPTILGGMIHVWQLFAPMLDEASAIDKFGAFIEKKTV